MPRQIVGPIRSTVAVAILAAAAAAAPSAAVDPNPPDPGYKKMFVTSTTGTGNLGGWTENTSPPSGLTGLAAGDKICQVRAEQGGFASAGSPIFRAWLSDSSTDAWCHVQGLTGKKASGPACNGGTLVGGGPWVRVDGEQFSLDLDTLVADGAIHPPIVDETLAQIVSGTTNSFPWTGTYAGGTVTTSTCSDWTSADPAPAYGSSGRAHSVADWTFGNSTACNQLTRLFCFEQGSGPAPPKPAEAGGLVFVTAQLGPGDFSDSMWQPDSGNHSGLEGADDICRYQAAEYSLPNPTSFVAWLSSSTVDAKDRIGDVPWKTLDGWLVAASKADLIDGTIATPIRRAANDTSVASSSYWTGSTQSGTVDLAPGATCQDWAGTSTSDYGTTGSAGREDLYWTTFSGTRCDSWARLLCFSDIVLLGWDNFETGDLRRWSEVVPGP